MEGGASLVVQWLRLHTSNAGMQGVWVWSLVMELTNGSVVKNLPANAGDARDTGSIPGWGISLREGNGNPLQHSCLEISMDREAWQATVHGVAKNGTWQSTHIQCRELRSYMLHGAAKKNKTWKQKVDSVHSWLRMELTISCKSHYITWQHCQYLADCCCCSVTKSYSTLCDPWGPRAHLAPVTSTISQSLLKFMSIELMMISNHLILCCPLSFCLQSFPASGSFPMRQLFGR